MTDIPLRDQIADWMTSRDSEWDRVSRKAYLEEADALLERFDISLRSSHPTPDANEEPA